MPTDLNDENVFGSISNDIDRVKVCIDLITQYLKPSVSSSYQNLNELTLCKHLYKIFKSSPEYFNSILDDESLKGFYTYVETKYDDPLKDFYTNEGFWKEKDTKAYAEKKRQEEQLRIMVDIAFSLSKAATVAVKQDTKAAAEEKKRQEEQLRTMVDIAFSLSSKTKAPNKSKTAEDSRARAAEEAAKAQAEADKAAEEAAKAKARADAEAEEKSKQEAEAKRGLPGLEEDPIIIEVKKRLRDVYAEDGPLNTKWPPTNYNYKQPGRFKTLLHPDKLLRHLNCPESYKPFEKGNEKQICEKIRNIVTEIFQESRQLSSTGDFEHTINNEDDLKKFLQNKIAEVK